jgi:DNA-binding NarL/FixJ family response regulator
MNTTGKNIRVFLVDDHKSFADGLAMLINTNKSVMEVVGMAHSKTEALASIVEAKPDVVLLDIDLGDENGIEMLPELIQKTSAKFIILTGTRNPVIHETAILKGARGVLLKSDSGKVILKAIEKVNLGELWLDNRTLNKVLSQLTQQPKRDESEDPEVKKIASLTPRESEIIKFLIQKDSSTNKEISESLFISDSTLKNHLTTIYSKLGVKNRIELLKYALKHNLDKD